MKIKTPLPFETSENFKLPVVWFLLVIPGVWIVYADVSEHYLFHLHRQVGMKYDWIWEKLEYL